MFMFSTDLYRHRAVTVPTDRTEASLCAQSGGLTPHGRPQGLRAVLSPLPYQQWGQGQPLLIASIGTDSKPQNDSHIPRPHDTSGQPCWAVDQSQGTSTSIPLASHSLEPHLQIVRACWAESPNMSRPRLSLGGHLDQTFPEMYFPHAAQQPQPRDD